MNIQRYEAFIKVAEYKSISKAALDMGYTQSAVSKMLLELEKEWGLSLFNRHHDGVEITSAGIALIEDVRRIIHDVETLDFSVASLHGMNKGTIRLGAPISVSANLLPSIIKAFHNDYPNIKIELHEGEDVEISDLLRRGVIDVCVLPKPYSDKYYGSTIITDSLVAILPKNHPMSDEARIPLSLFENDEMIRLKEVADYDINRFLDENKINPNVVYEVNDDNVVLSMVEQGLGVAIDYEYFLRPLRYDVIVKPLDKTKERDLELCVKSKADMTPIIELFIECVKKCV